MATEPTAALICSGPSLAAWLPFDRRDYVGVVGVNRACCAVECDIVVMHDSHTWRMFWQDGHAGPMGRPPVLTAQASTRDNVLARWPMTARQHEWCVVRDVMNCDGFDWLDGQNGRQIGWGTYSSTIALAYIARHYGVTHIDAYGMDMAGTEDWDGRVPDKACRRDSRWSREAQLVAELVKVLGIELRRMRPQEVLSDG